MRIWDLRRGDDDDNRTSPEGRSLRSLVFAAVLELNYLKAPLGLLLLILGPALLIGLLPSLVVTYGHLLFKASALTGERPIAALASLAVLLAVALWLGRPLFTVARHNLWQLHHTLIIPIFVALRELLRALAERLGRHDSTPESLERGRRVATILAALLLASAGLALATVVDLSLGPQLVDMERVRPWLVVRAALGNAAVILGLAVVVESGYWIWRELTRRGPLRDWTPGPSPVAGAVLRVAHLSDLHIVGERYGYRMESGTHGPRGNQRMARALHQLEAIHARAPLDRVLLTGDITDAGTRAEWAAFLDLLRGSPEVQARVSFVPGNHDVNIVDRTNPARLDLPWSAGQSLRLMRVVMALDALQGERAHVVDHATGALGPTLRDYLRAPGRARLLRALARRGALRGRWEMAKVWDAVFPLVEPGPEGGHGLILLDSNARSHFALTNAIGVVDPGQLRALARVLEGSPGKAWLILLHHQVVEHEVGPISLRERIGLSLVNAPDLLATIAPHAARVLVLHGHRHRDWIGLCGDLVVCSAPSVVLGGDAAGGYRGSFHVHDVALGAGGEVHLVATERVSVG